MTLEAERSAGSEQEGRVRATPLARRIAQAHGVELAEVVGTGPGGRIRAADVRAIATPASQAPERAAPETPTPPRSHYPTDHASPSPNRPLSHTPADPVTPLTPVASVTFEADVTAATGAGVPHRPLSHSPADPLTPVASVTFEADVTAATGAGVPLAATVTAAVGALLRAHPALNGAWGGEHLVLRRRVHVAVGKAAPEGMRWAVVRDAGDLLPRGVARALRASGDGGEATFALVCAGTGGGWQSAAPPPPGTAACLSVGSPARRLVAWGDGVAVRQVTTLTLSYDARMVDHSAAAAFLRDLRCALEG